MSIHIQQDFLNELKSICHSFWVLSLEDIQQAIQIQECIRPALSPLQDNLILEEDLDFTGMEWHHVYILTVSNDGHNGSRSLNGRTLVCTLLENMPKNVQLQLWLNTLSVMDTSSVFCFVYFIISQVYHRIKNLLTHTLSTRNSYIISCYQKVCITEHLSWKLEPIQHTYFWGLGGSQSEHPEETNMKMGKTSWKE